MEHLVQDLLVLAAVDAGSPARPRLMDLDALVLEEATRARAGADVRIDTQGVSAAPAHADPDDVRRIVRNLMDNAVAHARSQVVLAVDVHGGWATADIVDDGPGIPVDESDRIFDRFRRGDTARSAGSGSGLGLAIARGLAERGGGRVGLLDSPGGAHLRLVLPIAPSEAGH
jgi:signal transduction histidine kinase